MATRPEPDGDGESGATLRAAVYSELRHRLITGRIAPDVPISTRGLAQQLGVSQMPVRDALSRLAAEGAVAIRSKRRITVPPPTPARLEEIMRARLLLEPEAAAQALPYLDGSTIEALRAADAALDAALARDDLHGYMESNWRFHFLIYRGRPQSLLANIIETLWMQFGPLMRTVYGRVGTAHLTDQHHRAIDAIARRSEPALRAAIAADIADGMALIGGLDKAA
ncbi:DNA-binding transcriptional regulator, GntR family [Sphingomonas laterariae]|uniref:DNA-binding transcriptional regulator, GntR family n=1 Tax=Edaphosphingomonas laterariae TaxID=861865 RepID=A0A239FMH4_9SPHN|nr:GntR family transcriptional regulator [Sphingomonas laterariae]SNS57144.1 DNA-binding transcriptional regulator, GntR family [Sphingomonas laterariae]